MSDEKLAFSIGGIGCLLLMAFIGLALSVPVVIIILAVRAAL